MNQELEIEFKNLVTKSNFHKLLTYFSITESDFNKQINYYFDTTDFQLRSNGSALRIREKQQHFTLTLKQPSKIGLLETHQVISEEEALNAFNDGLLPKGDICTQLSNSFQIELNRCQLLGSLITNRAEISYLNGILVFDHSFYLGTEDFEIEFEVTEREAQNGERIFDKLFSDLNIPIVKTDNKIKRFFSRKKEQLS